MLEKKPKFVRHFTGKKEEGRPRCQGMMRYIAPPGVTRYCSGHTRRI